MRRTIYWGGLIYKIAYETHQPVNAVTLVLRALTGEIGEALARGDAVQLTNFGTFYPSKRKAAKVRPIRGGTTVTVPARTVAAFRPGQWLKSTLASKRSG